MTALLSFILAATITPLVIWFYQKHNWLDEPQKNLHVKKTHTESVPRGGGLVIFSTVLILCLLFLSWDKYLIGIMLGALILAVIGFLDDIYNIHPGVRLVAGFLVAGIVVGVGIGIAYISNPFGEGVIHLNQPQIPIFLFGKTRTIWVLADLFALIFIVWNMNIVNWSKGVDGQMSGFVAIALVMIAALSQQFGDDPTQFNTTLLALIVAGTFGGLTLWNFYPQKIMPGYGAGSLAGYFIAVLAILSGAKVAASLMILAIPTADAIFTIGRRLVAGKSPFWGDRGHLHHKLMDILGWGRRRIALFYWLTSLGLGVLSLYLSTQGKLITIGLVTSTVFGFLIWAKLQQIRKTITK